MAIAMEIDSSLGRRERRKLEVRARILEAAAALFEESGFSATTVAAICERADVAHKTFFNHFPAKQDLLRELAGAFLGILLENLEEARKSPGTTRERIDFFFERVVENTLSAGPMHRELVTEIIHVAHEVQAESEHAHQLHTAFGAIILDGVTRGDVTQRHDADTLIDMLKGAFYALMFNWVYLEEYPLRAHAMSTARFLGDAMCVDLE